LIDISEIFNELFIFFERKDILVFKNGKINLNHNIKRIYLLKPKGKVRVVRMDE